MLTHIVCWKYREDVSEAEREEHVARAKALEGVIPEIETFVVGRDILGLERSFDTGLVATFADREALDRYTVHPEHQKVAEIGKRIAERAVSVDLLS
ncbi:MAG: stress responsive alpha-beta barrel domain-containing protein [Acidobacteria bacterium OLB17]|nr:MAG: stress responsive alpha-beta barrel domain-containing protein [Acidobacteria bacterium OLB17]MCZ2390611.1 Dabb family protein [Acidobacteriota bacterium]